MVLIRRTADALALLIIAANAWHVANAVCRYLGARKHPLTDQERKALYLRHLAAHMNGHA